MTKKTTIGGQALIEGIMMKGPEKTCLAVRKKDGTIDIEYLHDTSLKQKNAFFRLPVIRGVVSFIESLIQGYKALMISAEKSGFEEIDEDNGKSDSKLMNCIMVIGSVLGVALALVLFMWLPAFLFDLFKLWVGADATPYRSLFEGVIKIIIFVIYLILVSKSKDIDRVFRYHGAEHKTIFCYEHGGELSPESAKTFKRFHPRCGTSFMILMLIVSIIINGIISNIFPAVTNYRAIWVMIKFILVPIVCGLGYELIKVCGRHDNIATRIISTPGMWLQRITTKEPDESMLEVAIAALNEVIPEDPEKDKW